MTRTTGASGLRRRLHVQLDARAWPYGGLSPANKLIVGMIIVSACSTILETEPTLSAGYPGLFASLELIFTVFFLLEYCARLWTSVESERFGPGLKGRLRFVTSPAAIFDLLALAPALLSFVGNEAFLLRAVRLVRVLRLARLGRFSTAMVHIAEAVRSRRYELLLSLCIAGLLLLVSSAVLYLVEGSVQPETFGSIPRAMWWSVVTLTTVGYGDVYPVTLLGRLFGAVTAITGIGLIAMPTGILAGAFSEAIQRRSSEAKREPPEPI